jgi:Family of unknown function (DUF6511)
MICAVCSRQARGFGWFDARAKVADPRRDQSRRWLCSIACQNICHRRRGMIDPRRDERAAMEHAVAMAGEYVESLSRTDLMTWSPDEFMTLIEVIATAFTDRLRELAERPPEVPYP